MAQNSNGKPQNSNDIIDLDFIKQLDRYDDTEAMRRLLDRRQVVKDNLVNVGSLMFAGITSKVITGPLERVKIIQQTEPVWSRNSVIALKSRSAYGIFRELRVMQGIRSLWRGTFPNVLKTIATSFLRLGVFDQLRELILTKGDVHYKKPEKYLRTTIVAFLGSVISNTVVYPFERLRVIMSLNMRQVMATEKDLGVVRTLMTMVQTDGISSLYRGYLFNSLVSIPSTVTTLVFYDLYRDYLFKQGYLDLYSRYTLIGLVSTFSTSALVYPLDTVRRLIQADSSAVCFSRTYKGVWDCFSTLRKQEGFRPFYRGFGVNAVKTPLQTVIQLVNYEYFRRNMDNLTNYK